MFRRQSQADTAPGRFDWLSVALLLGAVILVYYLVPLVSLVVSQPPGEIARRLTDPDVVSAATTSVTAAVASTALGTVFGLPLAYWLARTDSHTKTFVTPLVLLPLVLPPVVSGMVLLTVVGPQTFLGELGARNGLPLTRSLLGVVLAQTFVSSPFIIVTAKAAFESVGGGLEYASQSLGKSRLTTFRKITLPLAWPGILAGITLAFARAIGEFGATIMLAYYPRTMPVQIWVSFSTLGLERAFPVAVILLGIAVATLVVLNALSTNPFE